MYDHSGDPRRAGLKIIKFCSLNELNLQDKKSGKTFEGQHGPLESCVFMKFELGHKPVPIQCP